MELNFNPPLSFGLPGNHCLPTDAFVQREGNSEIFQTVQDILPQNLTIVAGVSVAVHPH